MLSEMIIILRVHGTHPFNENTGFNYVDNVVAIYLYLKLLNHAYLYSKKVQFNDYRKAFTRFPRVDRKKAQRR